MGSHDAESARPDGLDVVYADNHLLVVNKPAGLLSQAAVAGDDNLVDRARAHLKAIHDKPGNVFIGLVHRLDRNTSGLMVLARTSKAASRLSKAFRERAGVDKRYLAVCMGHVDDRGALTHRLAKTSDRGVRVAAEGKEARLSYRCLARVDAPATSLVEISLHSGRKHQIRAQFAAAGHPLLGDPRYGRRSKLIARPALHALRLTLKHPVRQTELSFVSPPPRDLCELLERLSLMEVVAKIVC